MKRLFDIVTLSSRDRGLADPVSVITGGVAILSQIFPNIFGGGRRRLNNQDWLQLFPGAGYWTTALRNYLESRIHYDVDLKNIQPFTNDFIWDNRKQICPGVPDSCWTYNQPGSCLECVQALYKALDQEKKTGGNSPVGLTPGGIGQTIDWSLVAPLAIGGVFLALAIKKKKR